MIPAADLRSAADWAWLRDADPLVQRYRALFALLDWDLVPERDARRPWPGAPPHPRRAYLQALLVQLIEGLPFISHLRRFLVEHPLLVLELGFRPARDPTQPFGFDLERTVPGERWLRHQQQHLDHAVLSALLADTVHTLQAAIPALGTTVAIDVKHIYAWVVENNPKCAVAGRCDQARQPRGDPDCRLGVKRRHNQDSASRAELVWGYGSGIVSSTTALAGDVVLAEWTQPFNQPDITYAQPLDAQAAATLGYPPTNLTADAAFDAWHVYQRCAVRGGIAAIPLNERRACPARSAAGHPLCDQGYVMTPASVFMHDDGYRARHYRCPLHHQPAPVVPCPDPRFADNGCRKVVNIEPGGIQRLTLDRHAEPYRGLYRQRTSAERINSQATALGIERPHLRRQAGIVRRNTLIYLVINLRAVQRLHRAHATRPPPVLC